jgi:hypothetical protein
MSKDFAKAADDLPKNIRAKLMKVFFLLTSDPKHPSLQVKKIQGSKRNDVYECRVDQSWRMVMRDLGDMQYDLVAIGEHDKTIAWGANYGAVAAGAMGITNGGLGMAGGALGSMTSTLSIVSIVAGIAKLINKKATNQLDIKENSKLDTNLNEEMLRLSEWFDGNDAAMEFLPLDITNTPTIDVE